MARAYLAPGEGRSKAEAAAKHALALDADLAEAHAALGQVRTYLAPYNFLEGDVETRRALEMSPSLAIAHEVLGCSLLEQGRFDEGLEMCIKARELDPLSPIIPRLVAHAYLLKRDYRRALELLQQSIVLGPSFAIYSEVEIYIQGGAITQALAELEKAKRDRKDDPTVIYSAGMLFAAQGKRTEALQIIKQLDEASGSQLSRAHLIARIYAMMGEKEFALGWLERGLQALTIPMFYKDAPVWDTIRDDPRFLDLMRRMGIPK